MSLENSNHLKKEEERKKENKLTGFEENDGAETSVFGGVDVHLLELGHRFLESLDFAEEAQLALGADCWHSRRAGHATQAER